MHNLAGSGRLAGSNLPKVSVLMAAFNAERFIREAVDSVLSQNFASLELVVVNDGSSDGTAGMLQSYGNRIRLLEQPNLGAVHARNRAFQSSAGEYVVIMDADDLMNDGAIRIRAAFLDDNPQVDLVYGETEKIDRAGQVLGRIPLRYRLVRNDKPLSAFATGNVFPVHAAMVRRRVIEAFGQLHDEKADLIPDWDLWARVACNARMEYVPQVVGSYRHHGGMSLARLGRRRGLRQTLNTQKRIAEWEGFDGLAAAVRRDVLRHCLVNATRLRDWKEVVMIGQLGRRQCPHAWEFVIASTAGRILWRR
jgi:glycosyltransferase involved in cell wall biosynthesis